jgi:uncharacterized protein (DUF4415 family)
MAVRRVGNVRPNDSTSNIWGVAPNHIPGDVLSGAPGYGGQSLREAPGPVITEEHMVIAPDPHEKRVKAPPKERQKRITKAVMPQEKMEVAAPPEKRNINLRVPVAILERFKEPGPGYQSRMVSVLQLFLDQGGRFVGNDEETAPENNG